MLFTLNPTVAGFLDGLFGCQEEARKLSNQVLQNEQLQETIARLRRELEQKERNENELKTALVNLNAKHGTLSNRHDVLEEKVNLFDKLESDLKNTKDDKTELKEEKKHLQEKLDGRFDELLKATESSGEEKGAKDACQKNANEKTELYKERIETCERQKEECYSKMWNYIWNGGILFLIVWIATIVVCLSVMYMCLKKDTPNAEKDTPNAILVDMVTGLMGKLLHLVEKQNGGPQRILPAQAEHGENNISPGEPQEVQAGHPGKNEDAQMSKEESNDQAGIKEKEYKMDDMNMMNTVNYNCSTKRVGHNPTEGSKIGNVQVPLVTSSNHLANENMTCRQRNSTKL